MLLENWTMALERHDNASVTMTIHHGGTNMRLELSASDAAIVGEVMSGRPVVPEIGPAIKEEASDESRPDGYEVSAASPPPPPEK